LTTNVTFWLYESALVMVGIAWIHVRLPRLATDVAEDLRRLVASSRRSWQQAPAFHRLALGVLILIGLVVRLVHLNQPMRPDEASTYVHYASRSLANALSNYSLPNNHVFSTLLIWLSSRVLGSSPPVLRLPALLSGLAIIPLVYLVGRRFTSAGGALLATAAIACTPCMVLYSTDARGYSLVCVAFLALLALGTTVDATHASSFSLAFAGTTALGMFTIPAMVYPAGAAAGMALLMPRADGRRTAHRLRRLGDATVVALILTIVLYGPIIARSGWRRLLENRFVTPLGWNDFLHAIPGFLASLRELFVLGLSTGVALALSFSVLLCLAFPYRRARLRRLAAITFVWCVVVLIAMRRPPFARVWLFIVPVLALMAGDGMARLVGVVSRRTSRTSRTSRADWLVPVASVSIAVWLGVGMIRSRAVFRSDEGGTFREAPAVARILLDLAGPTDGVIASTQSEAPLDYYLVIDGGHPLGRYSQPVAAQRIFIVVNGHDGQGVDQLRQSRSDINWDRFSTPDLVDGVGPAAIYVCDRRTSGGGLRFPSVLVPTPPRSPAPPPAR
jgi:hypothetical protein